MNEDKLTEQLKLLMANYLVSVLNIDEVVYAKKATFLEYIKDKHLPFELRENTLDLAAVISGSLNDISEEIFQLGNIKENVSSILSIIQEWSLQKISCQDLLTISTHFELDDSLTPLRNFLFNKFIEQNDYFKNACKINEAAKITHVNLTVFNSNALTFDETIFFSLLAKNVELTIKCNMFSYPEREIIPKLIRKDFLFKLKPNGPVTKQFMDGLLSYINAPKETGCYLQRSYLDINYADLDRENIMKLNRYLDRNQKIMGFINTVKILNKHLKDGTMGTIQHMQFEHLQREYTELSSCLLTSDKDGYQALNRGYQQMQIEISTPSNRSSNRSVETPLTMLFEKTLSKKRELEESEQVAKDLVLPSKKRACFEGSS